MMEEKRKKKIFLKVWWTHFDHLRHLRSILITPLNKLLDFSRCLVLTLISQIESKTIDDALFHPNCVLAMQDSLVKFGLGSKNSRKYNY